ncbi:MAG: ABC transporter substrate-binding protein [Pseudonocardiaceae bacterium]
MIALSDEPTNLNPIFGDLYGSIYGDHWPIFSSLLDYNQQLELTPDLAAALPEVSPDGLTVTLALHDGVRWHDGEPLTAQDVVFTYRAFLNPAVATTLRDELYDTLASVDAVGERTVRFGLSRVDPAFLDKLTLGIVPEHVLAGQDLNTTPFNLAPVGTGPFVFDELRSGERMTLRANPDYYGGKAGIARVVFSFVPDENVRATRLRSGELDVDAVGLPPRVADEVGTAEGVELIRIPGESTLMHLPHQNPLFADLAVREAVNLAVDREAIAKGVFAGAARPTVSPIPDGHWADSNVAVPRRDLTAARATLDAAGWKPGPDGVRQRGDQRLAFSLGYSAGSAVSNNVGLAVRDQLAEIGMRVELEGLGFEAFSEKLGQGVPQINTQSMAYDPALEAFRRYHSSGIADDEVFTDANQLNSPAVDAAVEKGRSTLDRAARAAAYGDMERAIAADASYLYLVEGRNSLIVRDRVQGVRPQVREGHIHGFSRGLLWNLHEWRLAAP